MSNSNQPRKTKWWLIVLLALLCALIVLAGCGYFYYQDQRKPVVESASNSSTEKPATINFTIESGQGPAAIAQNLKSAGLIKNAHLFRYQLKKMGLQDKVRAGVFQLSPTYTLEEIAITITTPPEQISITLLPGWRREEFASYLDDQGLYDFDADEFLELTEDLEGQLWADTYFVFPHATAQDIVDLLTKTFDQKVTAPYADEIAASDYDLNGILTIASILQRESKTKDEMKMIAGVIENRLDIEMPLQFCATAQYASGYDQGSKSWWLEPTLLDTKFDSPYNTYVYSGLPPGPIAAPGINAIEAALNPTDNEYFYYLHDSDGQIHYGKNGEEHQANIEKYLR